MSLEWILFGLRLLATVILCVFLGVAFYLIWRQLRQTESRQTVDIGQLRVISTAERQPLVAGQTLSLPPALVLGRSPENMLVVNPVDTSFGEVRLSRREGQWWLENLTQTEQVKLNNVFLYEAQPLSYGDTISIDDTEFCFETAE